MAIGENDNGWYLHSQGRRFGPLSEDDLRGYFRAGMVKSVDRITVPGQEAMLAAGEAAAMLGETAPVGPPPAPIAPAAPAVPPVAARAGTGDAPALDERAAKAIAAMNLELATMAMTSPRRKSSGWLLPVVAGVALIAMLFIGLSMMRKMSANAPGTTAAGPPQFPPVGEAPVQAAPEGTAPPTAEVAAPAPAEDESWLQKAKQLTSAADWPALASHATLWTQAQPNRTQAWQAMGLAQARLGNVDAAVNALNKVLTAEPDNSNARILLAEAYLGGQRWNEAADTYKILVAALPESPRLWNNYGVVLGKLGQGAQAVAALETAVRLDPGFREGWTNLSGLYQASGDNERAAAALAQAKALR